MTKQKMKKLLFVFNPFSGKAQIKNKLLAIVDIMIKAEYEVRIHPTQAREDAMELVKNEAKNFDLVVCSGGDGTLDEVVSGMMRSEKKVPIGYIPAGSTNDFANSLKISKNMERAAKYAVTGVPFPCDVGAFNEKSFIYIAAFGLFTDVSYSTSQYWKNLLGHAAYILEGARKIMDITSYKMRVEYEDQVIEDHFIYGMITNSTSVGGFKGMTGKDVKMDDGLFEVSLIRTPRNPLELNEILASLTNLIDNTDLIYSFKTSEVRFFAEDKVPWTLDGEFGGDHNVVTVCNKHQALEIMVKKKKEIPSRL